ncbi:DUF4190 domain-containing protein [Xylanimonas allomyrinae]|uniref:DUF4190 domain-containing protein n=2 Tax=Xylanimonas allomyrinae TaxID=2509459 RepID=A0A4P6EQ20_9MICO|nr:DUF4190 domain-containing protein [Xylanimonas allomyrinae]
MGGAPVGISLNAVRGGPVAVVDAFQARWERWRVTQHAVVAPALQFPADPWRSAPGGNPPARRPTDGWSVASLVTGLLGLGPVAAVLGFVGVRRTRDALRRGRGMAVTGIVLGLVGTIVGIVFVALATTQPSAEPGYTYGDNPRLDTLWDQCQAGDMGACDDLYFSSTWHSDYERFGDTCGGRTNGYARCDP